MYNIYKNFVISCFTTIIGFTITCILFPPGGENDGKNWDMFVKIPPFLSILLLSLIFNKFKTYIIPIINSIVIGFFISISYVFLLKNGYISFMFGVDLFLYIIFLSVFLKLIIEKIYKLLMFTTQSTFLQNEKITLRKGKAKDSVEIAELIYSSGPEAFNYMFFNKQKAIDYIKFEFNTSFPSLFGRTYAWVGEDSNGKVVASAINYNKNQYILMSIGTVLKIIFYFKFNSIKSLKRLSEMGKMVKPPREHEWFLTCFGVSQNKRGQGLGTILINQQMKWAKENGYLIYGLDVTEKNPLAQKLYERMGLKVYKNFSSHISSVPNFFRMELNLNNTKLI